MCKHMHSNFKYTGCSFFFLLVHTHTPFIESLAFTDIALGYVATRGGAVFFFKPREVPQEVVDLLEPTPLSQE